MTIFNDIIIPKISNLETVQESKDTIIEMICNVLDKDENITKLSAVKQKFFKNRLRIIATSISDISEEQAYSEYKDKIRDVSEFADTEILDNMAVWFKRNIYVIEDEERLPYPYSSVVDKSYPSVVLLWVNNNHYEVIGRMLPGKKIQRVFDHDDEFIKKIDTFLHDPKELSTLFPELYQYVTQRV